MSRGLQMFLQEALPCRASPILQGYRPQATSFQTPDRLSPRPAGSTLAEQLLNRLQPRLLPWHPAADKLLTVPLEGPGRTGEKSGGWNVSSGVSQPGRGVEEAYGQLGKSTGSGTITVLLWLCRLLAV